MSNVLKIDFARSEAVSNPFPSDSGLYFPVVEYPLYIKSKRTDDLMQIVTHKALVRADNGQPHVLSVVGVGYRVVQNKELFTEIESQFLQAFNTRQLSDVRISDRIAYNGREVFRDYVFPQIKVQTPGDKAEVAFRILAWNSFGGSSLKLYVGAIDFYCKNGMIIGEHDVYYHRHTSGIELTDVVKVVRGAIDVFYRQADIWRAWRNRKLTDAEVADFVHNHAGFSERRASTIMRRWVYESGVRGNNVWALYSALTYYASHNSGEFALRDTKENHAAATLTKRELEVRKIIMSDEFKKLAA